MRYTLLLLAACHHGSSAPTPPACTQVADHVAGMLPKDDAAHVRSIRDAFTARCAKDGWKSDARDCMLATTSLHDGRHCKDKLSAPQRAALDGDLEAIDKKRAMKLPAECEAYRAVVERLAACPQMPQASRDALKQSMEQAVKMWEATPPGDRRSMIEGCKAAVDAVTQSGTAICGW